MDRLITDLKEIARISDLNLERNTEFRTFLKHRLQWDDKELDAVVHEILSEVTAAIDCTACANCCREMAVSLDADDIVPLARHLGISPEEFEDKHIVMDGDYGEKIMPESPCILLGGNLCTVYEDRPKVCREFPHLQKPGFRQRLLGVIDSSALCPIVFNVLEELKRRVGWRGKR